MFQPSVGSVSNMTQRTGRPSKFTPERAAEIIAGVRAGLPREVAARRAGVDASTVYRWLSAGKDAEAGEFRDFLQSIEKADADCEALLLTRIQNAARGGEVVSRKTIRGKDGATRTEEQLSRPEWTAAAWILERKFRDRWGRNDRLELIVEREAQKIAEELGVDSGKLIDLAQRLADKKAGTA